MLAVTVSGWIRCKMWGLFSQETDELNQSL